jgi:hypothetical protein
MSQAVEPRPSGLQSSAVGPLRSGFLPTDLVDHRLRRRETRLTRCELRLAYLRTDALMQSHTMPSCEVSSDCLGNQIHPYGVVLVCCLHDSLSAAITQQPHTSSSRAMTLAVLDYSMITPAFDRNALWIAPTGTG